MPRPTLATVTATALLAWATATPAAPPAPLAPLPRHWQHGVFMEIFVRAWKDSDGDGIGDLKGLTSTLPYLQALGVRGLWLMPIQKNADGDHGYATTDYRDVAPEYGTLADFDELIRQARARGIGVIIDYVVNHSAAQHPFFVDARSGPLARHRDWYVWSPAMPQGWNIWGHNPWYAAEAVPWTFKGRLEELPPPPAGARNFYFGTFGPHMPDFNLRNPEVLNYHLESLGFWLERGLAGFRLDAVPHLVENDAAHWNDQPESRAMTRHLQEHIRHHRGPVAGEERYVVCEATAEPQAYGEPEVCGGAFAFGYVHHIVEAARGKPESAARVAEYWTSAPPTMATFLSNHDIFAGRRLADQLAGDEAAMRLAAATYLLQPGTPFIYYGEEVGMAGAHQSEQGLAGDRPIRSPMSWAPDAARGGFTSGTPFRPIAPNVLTHNAASERADPASLWHFYRAMIALRNALPSIARGRFERSRADGLVVQWQRTLGGERTLAVINYARAPAEVSVAGLGGRSRLLPQWPRGEAALRADGEGGVRLALAPQSLRVYVVEPAGRAPAHH